MIQKNGKIILAAVVTTAFYGFVSYLVFGIALPKEREQKRNQAKQMIIEKRVKQYEKTLPHYKEYLQNKQQIAHYRDSLQQTMK